jgi:hypothetical protein
MKKLKSILQGDAMLISSIKIMSQTPFAVKGRKRSIL